MGWTLQYIIGELFPEGGGETKRWSSKQLLDCSLALTVTSVIQLNNFNSCWNYVETSMVEQISLGRLSLLPFNSTRNAVESLAVQDPLFLFSMMLQTLKVFKMLLMKERVLFLSGLLLSWEWWNDYSFFLGLGSLQWVLRSLEIGGGEMWEWRSPSWRGTVWDRG